MTRKRKTVKCGKCKKKFLTKYKIGHWEICPHCGHDFYVFHIKGID